jgi:hypothetical protein
MYILKLIYTIMSIKFNKLYPLYLEYLKTRRLSKGAFELIKISESEFISFKDRYEKDPIFHDDQDKIFKQLIRDEKINDIIND